MVHFGIAVLVVSIGADLPADAARAAMRLAPGLRIELVAEAPLLESPVAMAFDEDGRLWVVEMRDYPMGPPAGQPPLGRIKCLEDRDGDGKYETSRVFADRLSFANGLQPWRGGLIVTAGPHILYLKDTDGDGRADQRDIWFEGFANGNPQLRVSSPQLAIDNWVYVCSGLRGGKIKRPSAANATAIDISGKDFRFDPRTLKGEAVSGPGQFGQAFDDHGRRFVCDNRHHLRHVVFEERHLRRNPFLVVPSVLEDISELAGDDAVQAGAPIYPISKNWTTSNLHAGRFTAACGLFIYDECRLPGEYWGGAFVCEPTGNLVRHEDLRAHGATFRSKPLRAGVEFLASTDDWFRPVFLCSGPDSALYVVDMDRPVIEHPEWMPPEERNRPDLAVGRDRGRIWRILSSGTVHKRQSVRLRAASKEQLIFDLYSMSEWKSMTAQRLLLESNEHDTRILHQIFQGGGVSANSRVAALLHARGEISEVDIRSLIRSHRPDMFECGISYLADLDKISSETCDVVISRLEDKDPRVRFCSLLALGGLNAQKKPVLLAKRLHTDGSDPWLRHAIYLAANADTDNVLTGYVALANGRPGADQLSIARDLATVVGAWHDRAKAMRLLDSLRTDWQMAVLDGLATGWTRRGNDFAQFVNQTSPELREKINAVFVRCIENASNINNASTERTAAIRLLAHAPSNGAEAALVKLVQHEPRPELRLAAVRSLAARSSPSTPTHLISAWPSAAPAIRQEITQALLSRTERATALLDAVAAGKIAARELDASAMRRLTEHSQPTIHQRARELLGAAQPDARKVVLAKYKTVLNKTGDVAKGRELYRVHCAACHRVDGIGTNVGPDISDLRTKTAATLLNDILDPNAAIDANYVTYQVQTTAGRSFTGLLAADTASGVTLRRGENQTDTILRADIESVRSTGQSLMPDGMENAINVEQMADLLAFLKNWRYEQIPKSK